MSPAPFQLWRDYFQLAKLVEAMKPDGEAPERPRHPQPPPQQPRDPRPPPVPAAAGCSFCKQNGESRAVYASHRLKDEAGRVQCPILRKYTCPQCGASEDRAHTRRFCPLTQQGYISVYTSCFRNSAGKRRKKKAS